ncbi:hypothetical protein E8E11_000040, partial [Didymella keratinophila]
MDLEQSQRLASLQSERKANDLALKDLQKRVEVFNHDNSPLLRLPAELRNRIDRLLFSQSPVCVRHDIEWKDRLPSILPVCRQTYADTKLLLWAHTEFSIASIELTWFMSRPTAAQATVVQRLVLTVKPDLAKFVCGVIGGLVGVESVIAEDDVELITAL